MQEQPIKLEEIIPRSVEFSLRSTQDTYSLRPFSLDDNVWLQAKYSEEELGNILQEMKMDEIVKIAYHQLTLDDKKKFLAGEVEDVNDDGELITRKISGPEKFMRAIQGLDEEFTLYKSLLESRGMSLPVIEKIGQQLENDSKKKGKRQ